MFCLVSSTTIVWYLYHAEQYRPPVGVYIAVVGVLAAGVTFRSEPTKREKALWILTITILVVGEISGLYKADTEQKKQYATITSGLRTSIDALNTTIAENQKHFDKTIGKIDDAINTETGGDSFVFIDMEMGQFLTVIKKGDSPLHGVTAHIMSAKPIPNFTDNKLRSFESRWVNLGDLPAGKDLNSNSALLRHHFMVSEIPPDRKDFNLDSERVYLQIEFYARNGSWMETLQLHSRSGIDKEMFGRWSKACLVYKLTGQEKKTMLKWQDKDFPKEDLAIRQP
jgi:hypothetical protein